MERFCPAPGRIGGGGISLYRLVIHSNVLSVSREALGRRRPYRGPSERRPLRIRFSPKRRAGSESLVTCLVRQRLHYSSSRLRVTPLLEAKMRLFTHQSFCRAKVIHHRLRGEIPKLSSPLANNFGRPIRLKCPENRWAHLAQKVSLVTSAPTTLYASSRHPADRRRIGH